MVQTEYQTAVTNLKRVLKKHGVTYRDLAKEIGLSESGVKKVFSARDGSFQRLAEICRYLGISLAEIIEDVRVVDVTFSKVQQQAFLKDPLLFQYYWMLVYERRSQESVKRELKLKDTENFRLVRKLDRLNMIRLLPGDRIRIPSIKAVRWKGDGEFVRKIFRNWSYSLLDSVATPEVSEEKFFLLRYLQMTKSTYAEFLLALRSLEAEFTRRSINEMKSRPSELKHVRWLSAVDNRSFVTNEANLEF